MPNIGAEPFSNQVGSIACPTIQTVGDPVPCAASSGLGGACATEVPAPSQPVFSVFDSESLVSHDDDGVVLKLAIYPFEFVLPENGTLLRLASGLKLARTYCMLCGRYSYSGRSRMYRSEPSRRALLRHTYLLFTRVRVSTVGS